MNYAQIDIALTFLENPDDEIVLQVPYHIDVQRVTDYIYENYLSLHPMMFDRTIRTVKGNILFDVVSTGRAGYERIDIPHFLIERDNGDDGTGAVDAIE